MHADRGKNLGIHPTRRAADRKTRSNPFKTPSGRPTNREQQWSIYCSFVLHYIMYSVMYTNKTSSRSQNPIQPFQDPRWKANKSRTAVVNILFFCTSLYNV